MTETQKLFHMYYIVNALPFLPPLPPLLPPDFTDEVKGNTSIKVKVAWTSKTQDQCWMEEQGDVIGLVSPILQKCLETGNQPFLERILRVLKSKSIYHGTQHLKDGISHVLQQRVLQQSLISIRESNAGELSSLSRICLSESQPAMSLVDDTVGTEIAEFAVHDLLFLINRGEFSDNTRYYGQLTTNNWNRLPQHERLAISFALRPFADNFKSRNSSDSNSDGWEDCNDHAALASRVHEKVRNSILLSLQISSHFRKKRHGNYSVNVYGPFSLAVYSVIAANSADKPSFDYHPWPEENADTVARAAQLAFACLRDTVENSGLENTSTLLEKFQATFINGLKESACSVICALGSGAEETLQSMLNHEEICSLVINHEFSCNKSLLHLCNVAARLSPSRQSKLSELANMILAKDYQVNQHDALKCIRAICLGNMAGMRENAEVSLPLLPVCIFIPAPTLLLCY